MKYSRVYVEITNICNRSCSFCHGTSRKMHSLTLSEFSFILDSLDGVTEYIYLHVMGEPLTHPGLADFISLATSRGFKCAVTTNGTLLSSRGDALISSGVYKMNISLHSFEEGSADAQKDYLTACFDFADKASRQGVLTVLRLWNRGADNGRNIDILAMLRDRFPDGEWREGARGFRLRHRLHLEWGDRFGWPDANGEDLGDGVYCHGLGDHFGILSDGTVIPCCLDSDAAVNLGNVFDVPLNEILSSGRAVSIREGFKNKKAVEELCKRCPYARRFKI